jgi:hypothetical protein
MWVQPCLPSFRVDYPSWGLMDTVPPARDKEPAKRTQPHQALFVFQFSEKWISYAQGGVPAAVPHRILTRYKLHLTPQY